jgi:MGT family glycosyltransferase
MPFRYLHLAAEPPGFNLPGEAPAPTTHYLRPVEADHQSSDGQLPPWVAALPDRPTVHASLGTFFGTSPEGRSTFAAILAALGGEPINLILTVGPDTDPAQFGPQPEHVHVARYLPHSALLPHCAAFVTHGGYGSLMAGLNAGLPLVVIPISADQPYNAACCAALGVGRLIAPEDRTPEAIRAAVRAVLSDTSYRANAEHMRDAMTELPGMDHAVALLERLAREKRPIAAA